MHACIGIFLPQYNALSLIACPNTQSPNFDVNFYCVSFNLSSIQTVWKKSVDKNNSKNHLITKFTKFLRYSLPKALGWRQTSLTSSNKFLTQLLNLNLSFILVQPTLDTLYRKFSNMITLTNNSSEVILLQNCYSA